jgi:hypothetical protein
MMRRGHGVMLALARRDKGRGRVGQGQGLGRLAGPRGEKKGVGWSWVVGWVSAQRLRGKFKMFSNF